MISSSSSSVLYRLKLRFTNDRSARHVAGFAAWPSRKSWLDAA
jgi:hypothetical protein